MLIPVTTTICRSAALYSQIGCDHEPHAEKALAIGLTGGSVSREGVERMAVILDLGPVCIHLDAQFPGERAAKKPTRWPPLTKVTSIPPSWAGNAPRRSLSPPASSHS